MSQWLSAFCTNTRSWAQISSNLVKTQVSVCSSGFGEAETGGFLGLLAAGVAQDSGQ